MRISGSQLLRQSFVYLFSSRRALSLVGIAVLVAPCFTFLIEGRFYLGIDDAYWAEIPRVFLSVVWQLWLVGLVLADIRGKSKSFLGLGKQAIFQVCSVWWLIVWLVVLQWASVPLVRESYCFGESVDLALFGVVGLLFVVQVCFNFFMFPAIARGEYSFKKLLVSACTDVLKYFVTLLVFFTIFGLLGIVIFFFTGLFFSLVHSGLDLVIMHEWLVELFKAVWTYSVSYTMFALLGIAQALFYVRTHKT